jgi:hypothetical protein
VLTTAGEVSSPFFKMLTIASQLLKPAMNDTAAAIVIGSNVKIISSILFLSTTRTGPNSINDSAPTSITFLSLVEGAKSRYLGWVARFQFLLAREVISLYFDIVLIKIGKP